MDESSNVAAEIQRIYEQERHDRPVRRAGEVPPTYAAITADWLTDVLCRKVPGAEVTEFKLDARDDGSSNRRRIFLSYNEAGARAGLPVTVFCKAADALQQRVMLGASGVGKSEADFYLLARPRLPIEAPVAYHAGYDPSNYASLIMLKDLAGSVTFADERTPVDWSRAVSLVTNLADLHGPFYESSELGSPTLPFLRWDVWWKRMIAGNPRFPEFCDIAFGDSESLMEPHLFKRRAEIWPATDACVDRHADLPLSLIHSDVHFKNWYVTADNRMGLSDWQTTTIGHWSRDYVYATTTALTIENRRAWEDELLRIYLDRMAEHGARGITVEYAKLNMRQQLFTVLAFWTITLRPAIGMPDMQPERTTVEFLRRIYAAIDDHDALDSF